MIRIGTALPYAELPGFTWANPPLSKVLPVLFRTTARKLVGRRALTIRFANSKANRLPN
jgi:hypothetical protein